MPPRECDNASLGEYLDHRQEAFCQNYVWLSKETLLDERKNVVPTIVNNFIESMKNFEYAVKLANVDLINTSVKLSLFLITPAGNLPSTRTFV